MCHHAKFRQIGHTVSEIRAVAVARDTDRKSNCVIFIHVI